jgi:hypothetical protein
MDRRSFLQSLVVAAAGSELIMQASPQDIARFAKPGDRVMIAPPSRLTRHFPDYNLQDVARVWTHQMLYDQFGNPVAVVKTIDVQHPGWRPQGDVRQYDKSETLDPPIDPNKIEVHVYALGIGTMYRA